MKEPKPNKSIKIDNAEETAPDGRISERDYSGIHYDDSKMTARPPSNFNNTDSPTATATSGSLSDEENRCSAVTRKGSPCSREAVNSKVLFCWQHARQRLERTLWGLDVDHDDDDLTPQEVIDIVLAALNGGEDEPDIIIDPTPDPEPDPIIDEDEEEEGQDDSSNGPSSDLPIMVNPPGGPIVSVSSSGPGFWSSDLCPANVSTYELNHLRPDNAVGMYIVDPQWVHNGGHNVVKINGSRQATVYWYPGHLDSTSPNNPLVEHFMNYDNWPVNGNKGDGDACGSYLGRGDWIFVWDSQEEMWCGRKIMNMYANTGEYQIQISTYESFDHTYTQSVGTPVRMIIFEK